MRVGVRRRAARFLGFMQAISLVAAGAAAQTADLRGVVVDASGGAIPDAHVNALGPSGTARATTTNSSGGFTFACLTPGKYRIPST